MRHSLLVISSFLLNACYTYVPVGGDNVPDAGLEVRAHLSPRDIDLGTITVRDVTRVDGIVYGTTPDSLAVWSSWVHSDFGTRFNSQYTVYQFGWDQVATLEARRFHPARSFVGVVVTVGVMTALFNFAADIGGDPSGGDRGGGTEFHLARPSR